MDRELVGSQFLGETGRAGDNQDNILDPILPDGQRNIGRLIGSHRNDLDGCTAGGVRDERQAEGLGNGVFNAGETVCLPAVVIGLKTGGIVDGRDGNIIQEKTAPFTAWSVIYSKRTETFLPAYCERSTDSWIQPLLCPVYAQPYESPLGLLDVPEGVFRKVQCWPSVEAST